MNSDIEIKTPSTAKYQMFEFAVPSIIVWVLIILVYWPGLMSHDSVVQWAEIVSKSFTDYHPAFHTLFEFVISRFSGGNPAGVPIVQILALSVVAGWGITYFRELGLSKWLCWCCAVMFAILPVNFVLVNSLWKDIPYGISVLCLSVVFLKIYKTDGRWLYGNRAILVGLLLALIALFRHNGIAVAALSGISLLIFIPTSKKPVLIALAVFAMAYFVVNGIIYPNLNVKSSADFKYGVFSYYLASQLSANTNFSDEELIFWTI